MQKKNPKNYIMDCADILNSFLEAGKIDDSNVYSDTTSPRRM